LQQGISALLFTSRGVDADALGAAVAVRELPAGHVAAPGRGVFAAAALPARTPLLVYGGEQLSDDQAEDRAALPCGARNGFVFSLFGGVACDAHAEPRCRAAYVNDPRGTGAAANCAFVEAWCGGGCHARADAGGSASGPPVHAHAMLCTLRDIAPGEELLASYGDAYWAAWLGQSAPVTRARASAARRVLRIAPMPYALGDVATDAAGVAGMHTSINVLEADVLLRIFAYLTVADDLAAVAAVQRGWRSLVRATPALWRAVTFRTVFVSRPARRALAVAAAAAGQLETLDLRPLGARGILSLALPGDRYIDFGQSQALEAHLRQQMATAAAAPEEEMYMPEMEYHDSVAMDVRNVARLRTTLESIAASNTGLRRLAVSASAVCDGEWETMAISSPDIAYIFDTDALQQFWPANLEALPFDGDGLLQVGCMWTPQALAAVAHMLPPHVALTADVQISSDAGVQALLALHAERELSLDALSLYNPSPPYDPNALGLLAAALSPAGRLGRSLQHVVVSQKKAVDSVQFAGHGPYLHEQVLAALADGGAPALHTLELRSASGVCVRSVAALLGSGTAAFSLKRLAVLMSVADVNALDELAAALPATLHTLVVDVRDSTDDPAAVAVALRTLLMAATERCPALRSAQLGTNYPDEAFVTSCRETVDAVAAVRPDVRVSYRAYSVRILNLARKSAANVHWQ
jgi:hypothetical protein